MSRVHDHRLTAVGWMVLFGLAVHMAGKVWFLDRMAMSYDDVAPAASLMSRVPRGSPAADSGASALRR